MVAMAVAAQHNQAALPLEAEPLMRPAVNFELLSAGAEIAGMAGLLERQRPDPIGFVQGHVRVHG